MDRGDRLMGGPSGADKGLLAVAEVAEYLGVGQVTVYRWCREGRLPCLKIGKSWRIRREAMDDFLRQGEERERTLAAQLRSFLVVPDNVIGIAQTPELLHRRDVAFFKVAEARGGLLVKFHGHESASEGELREVFERNELDVERLEREGRFRFSAEVEPLDGRGDALRRILSEEADTGRTVWATFDWMERVNLGEALEQQEELTRFVGPRQLVVKTAVLQEVADNWPSETQRQAQTLHSGMIWLSEAGLSLSRVTPLPPE
ncbi:MAG: helix-turn-helix domain-containing protein [Rubrobacteraceae bacterium]